MPSSETPATVLSRFRNGLSTLAQRRAVLAIAVPTLFVIWAFGAWMTWFTWHLASDLPGKDDLRRLGDMAQATTLLDVHDKPAFTIYKEQRIEVPLARVSPLLIKAFVSVEMYDPSDQTL